jgi:hypothetical protein
MTKQLPCHVFGRQPESLCPRQYEFVLGDYSNCPNPSLICEGNRPSFLRKHESNNLSRYPASAGKTGDDTRDDK